jgi:hypothetical protein
MFRTPACMKHEEERGYKDAGAANDNEEESRGQGLTPRPRTEPG